MENWPKLLKAKLDRTSTAQTTNAIRALDLQGFGGACGDAAITINQLVFGGKGKYVAAVNKLLWKTHHRFVGHVAVFYGGGYWDSDAVKKSWDEIESWGMLDPEDPDYSDLPGWNEEAAYETLRLNMTESDIRRHVTW